MNAVHRMHATFGALIAAQALHSIEEYSGRLYETFPARPLHVRSRLARPSVAGSSSSTSCSWPSASGVISGRSGSRWAVAPVLAWGWAAIEAANGIGHLLWSLWQGAYQPGVATAPLLLVLALSLGYQLRLRPHGRTALGFPRGPCPPERRTSDVADL